MADREPLRNIPTNIITGFLGVGKTTAIEHLLRNKPTHEKWAVLVNEFGEVGVDASLVAGKHGEEQGVYLKEVPGGCMCCASGLPMQIALNMLLQTAKPDRLLIEPTGLGHPKEVLSVLGGQYYSEVLRLQATITLLDARKLADPRVAENPTFQQQLEIADVLVANKADLYQPHDSERLKVFYGQEDHLQSVPLQVVEHGQLQLAWLRQASRWQPTEQEPPAEQKAFVATSFAPALPECGYLRIDNHAQGFASSGWLFSADFVFDDQALYALLLGVEAIRLKAVFITDSGVIGYNKVDDVLSRVQLDDALDSRIELIGDDLQFAEGIEDALLACALQRPGSDA